MQHLIVLQYNVTNVIQEPVYMTCLTLQLSYLYRQVITQFFGKTHIKAGSGVHCTIVHKFTLCM